MTEHTPRPTIGRTEFVALMAMLVATVAFSIDAMLPALPRIASELSPEAPNHAQLVVTSFVFGMGVGTFLAGPLSDSYGRKPVVLWGSVLYVLACALAWAATSLELVMLARVLQGLGASAARVVPMAITRDYYAGRGMARIVSFIMMVFTLVPAVAPLIGSFVIAYTGWRGLFGVFALFALLSAAWLGLRVAEPLPKERRLPFRAKALKAAVSEVLAHPVVRLSTVIQTLCFVGIFASLSTIHALFDTTYHRAESFPYWFCLIALVSGGFSLLNASLVMHLGMRRLVRLAMATTILISLAMLAHIWLIGPLPFVLYLFWQTTIFVHTAMTLGNLNAIALEPMGHIAGTATSVFSALATVGSVMLTIPIGLAFDGTPVPLIIGLLAVISLAYGLMHFLNESEDVE
ncbi:MFS transporter [Roseovarius faecimaris]|uniref:MFS transporter n=1 Tax=Roseovarius faecimaris TaxID=2494550 RepID=A0A6I6IRC4_9RHOB|nr:multidrug effflux MFS transporter [Roseovarius faecimaris]QGX98431.1 MFS transporter [Roseovarius faecimaris]